MTKLTSCHHLMITIGLPLFILISACSPHEPAATDLEHSADKNLTSEQPKSKVVENNNDSRFGSFDPDASRQNGAWGAVYMSDQELNDTDRSVVDTSNVPTFANDPALKKWNAKFGDSNEFNQTSGERLYHDSCAGCHMHDGKGAYGAGYYPPLADNTKMQSKYYIIDILINGFRGMPSFHAMLNDEQMAAVTEYVRSELNDYSDPVSAKDVAQLRHEHPPTEPSF